jgi:hypothetical protein
MLTRFFKWLTSPRVVRVLLWVLHVVVVVLVVLGLWYVNRRYRVETELLSPFPGLHSFWLPLLFLLLYGGAWLGWWFFRLLTDPRDGKHPGIDDAWTDGLRALHSAGIDPAEVPLFLVVGTPESSPADFFAATKLAFAVRAEPRRPDAPVRVYATRDAVFVTAEGASVLSRLAVLLAARARAKPVAAAGGGDVNLLDSPALPAAVLPGESQPMLPTGASSAAQDTLGGWLPRPGSDVLPALPADEADRQAARLTYLCRLIAERRRPFCPANGVLWLLPLAGTESDALAEQVAAACRADLHAAEAGLQVYCPAVAVVCDAQLLPGFRDLLRGLPEPLARERLLGRSFPLVPGVPPEQRAGVIFDGIDWVARHLVPGVVLQRIGTEAEGTGDRWSAANVRLWRLADELAARRAALARVLAQGIADGSARPPMLAGVYFAGTGPDEQDQAFAAGVVQQIVGLQNSVKWTEAADAEERDYRQMTAVGYAAVLALLVGVGAFAYTTWTR